MRTNLRVCRCVLHVQKRVLPSDEATYQHALTTGANEKPVFYNRKKQPDNFSRPQPHFAWTIVYGHNFYIVSLEVFNFPGKMDFWRRSSPTSFSRRSWIICGVISCAPHTSFNKINDSVVKFEHGEPVRGFDRSTFGVQC